MLLGCNNRRRTYIRSCVSPSVSSHRFGCSPNLDASIQSWMNLPCVTRNLSWLISWEVLLMEEILHHLRLVVHTIICRAFLHPSWRSPDFWTINCITLSAHKYIKKKLVSLSCKVYEVHSSTCVFPRILWVCDRIFIASWVGEWHPELGDWKDPASSKCVKFHKISTQNITQKLPKITQGRNCTIL